MAKQPKKPTPKSVTEQPTNKKPAVMNAANRITAPKSPAEKSTVAAPQVPPPLKSALPNITSPAAGSVTANTNLTVTISTNEDNLPYVITMHDITGRSTLVYTNNIAAPNATPFSHVIPGTYLPSGRTFKIVVIVDPSAGSTPPHAPADVTVTT